MPAGLHDDLKNGPEAGAARPYSLAAAATGNELAADLKLEKVYGGSGSISGVDGGHQATGHNRYRWLKITAQAYLLVPVAALLLEVLFSLAGIGQSEIVKPDLQLGCRHIPNKLVTWRLEGYSHGRLNDQGMRDDEHALAKAEGVKRIAFLGDSYTEGLQVPLEDTFAHLLQQNLQSASASDTNDSTANRSNRSANGGPGRFETLNFGCSSYSTGQEYLQYNQQVSDYKPDLVVLLYTPGDTLENSVSAKDRVTAEARPYFYIDNKGQLQQDNGLLALNYEKLKPRPLREFLRAHSTIYGAYNQINLSLSMSDKVYFRTTRLISQVCARLTSLLTHSKQAKIAPGLLSPAPAEPDKVAVSQGIIKKLAKQIQDRGGRLIVMTYPDLTGADPLYSKVRLAIKDLARADNFGFLDLTEAFSRVKNPNQLFIKVHFSKEGHDLTARALTTYLQSSGYLPE